MPTSWTPIRYHHRDQRTPRRMTRLAMRELHPLGGAVEFRDAEAVGQGGTCSVHCT
ncbi:hypothetical protein PIB30_107920, partial [Stylosanthes scabra]|nr:hypothetical protein [Stylosanthes scabra]